MSSEYGKNWVFLRKLRNSERFLYATESTAYLCIIFHGARVTQFRNVTKSENTISNNGFNTMQITSQHFRTNAEQ